jgi:hypothetical protein
MSKITDDAKKRQLTVYLPDTRGVTISRFGVGNLKIGLGVHTYSRLPGKAGARALGIIPFQTAKHDHLCDGGEAMPNDLNGTCPGATKECQEICYAARPVSEDGPVFDMWARNSATEDVPMELPPDCTILRLHISGDFSTRGYIDGWYALLAGRPDVKVWAYTRSWRVSHLRPALERLRALPNMQLFASVDSTTPTSEIESIAGSEVVNPWRIAWIDGDSRGDRYNHKLSILENKTGVPLRLTQFGRKSLVCPEETGGKANCVECKYCFDGKRNDVTFLKH